MTWWDAIVGLTETALDFGASFVPGGNLVKKGLKWGLKAAKVGTGVAKDYFSGGNVDFDGLSSDIGDLKNGLAGAKAQIETQGKELHGKIDTVKTELLNQMNQQGAKFDQEIKSLDAKIANLAGEQKKQAEEQKKELQKQKEELNSAITQVNEDLNRVENKLTEAINDLRNEVNERFEQQEKKILDNKRKIEEERIQREEEIRETQSKIKITNTNLENLRKEKEQLNDDFLNYKSTIDRKTAETDQNFEDLEAEYQRKNKIIETKLADNEELLQEFQEDLVNVKHEQAQAKLERTEILEELSEQSDLLHFQKHQMNLVAQQMEDVSEEIHERMGKVEKDHNKLFTLATDTSQKLSNLTEKVNSISKKTFDLEQQIKENKEIIEKVKKEAQLANERLDNYLKSQQLLDHSAEESAFNKIEKSLELKAEETKLLATLKLLQETKKLITLQPAERNWKVGVETGTTPKDFKDFEGIQLAPNSYWEKRYTGTQIKPNNPHSLFTPQWFQWEEENKLAPEDTKIEPWGERIQSEHETAPLTTPDKRQEQQTSADQAKNNQTTEEQQEETNELLFEQLETAKTELLTRLQEIQGEIQHNLTSVEEKATNSTSQPKTKAKSSVKPTPSNFTEELEQKLEEQDQSIQQDKQEEETQELDVNQKLAELTQQLQEMEQQQVAHQKQMSKWMLFLIIFLLEYVVYKKNGVLGLVILNVILAILYYKKDTILQYRDLWEKYFLIIGYVLGNVLAYSAPENPKYKWPSVIGFNLIVLGIYGYTLWQQKQEQAKLEEVFQEKTSQICQENNITSQEWKTAQIQENLLDNYSPFSNSFTATKQQQLTNLQEIIQEQEIIQQKALELQQQSELLQKSAEIENNLKEIHSNLGESQMSWTKIKAKYPEFANRSVLLKELVSVERLLNKNTDQEPNQNFLNKLTRLATTSDQENNLLSQLRLTIEQFIALSQQAYRFTKEEQDWLFDNYNSLSQEQQLLLLNAGLNNLGIDTQELKENFVDLNHQIYQEQRNFGLSTKEKENILRLLVNTLNLSKEQQEYLESMGISFFNASNWHVDNAQKNHLLSFGLSKINLSEDQQKTLTNLASSQFKTFALTEEQKTILQSLAPLTREDKYSEDSLQLLKSLTLKQSSLTFFTSEEIIPNPNLDFGEVTSSYLSLKLKFLLGEQKVLENQAKLTKKEQNKKEFEQKKLSILNSLLEFAHKKQEEDNNSLSDFTNDNLYSLLETNDNEEEKLYQLNYLLEKWVNLEVLTEWQADILLTIGLKTIPKYNFFDLLKIACEITQQDFTEVIEANELEEDYQNYLTISKERPIIQWGKTITELQGNSSQLDLNSLQDIINQQIQQALSGYQPKQPEEEEIVTTDEEEEEIIEETPPPTPQTSRYDDLLANLSAEDTERARKKQEREEAKNKFEEAERQRRESKLLEKDKKLAEDAEKREQEKILAEQEDQKRKEAEEARAKALQEEQENYLKNKLENIENKKKAAELALENQKKENELNEQKKRDEITKLEKENQQEQERLAKQAELIEEEKTKKLASIALEDKEQRQLIEKRANEEKARIKAEMNDKKRKNEEELAKKENALLKQQQSQKIELERLQKEADLQNRIAEETKRIGREQERILKANRDKGSQLRAFRESLWQEVKNYYWAGSEARDGTRNPQLTSGGYLRDWLNSYPNIQFNLVGGDQYGVNWTNNSWKTAMQAFYRTAGNTFVDQYQFQRLLEQKVLDLGFLN